MTKPVPQKYRTTNWKDYNAALKQRGAMLIWIDKNMQWNGTPTGKKRGSSKTYSDLAIQFCLTIKSLYGLGLRQTEGMVESLIKLANIDWDVSDFSTLSRRQKDLVVNIPYRRPEGGLHLLVDSSGIKILGEGEWKTKKHGADYRRQWLKVHLAIDAESLEIGAIEVTTNQVGDAPMLPDLLNQIPANEVIESVKADGAYDTKDCLKLLQNVGLKPLSLYVKMQFSGKKINQGLRREMRFYMPLSGLGVHFGNSGAAIINAAWSRLKYGVLSCWVSVRWREILTVKWRSYKFARLF